MKENNTIKRAHLRFKPEDDSSLCMLDLRPDATAETFLPEYYGVLFSESFGGCGFLGRVTERISTGQICFVKIGDLFPLKAEIVWKKELDPEVIKVGVKFLE